MKILSPNIPKIPNEVTSFMNHAKDFMDDEMPIYNICISDENLNDEDFYKIDIQQSIFLKSTFQNCNFEKTTFINVEFEGCDFSNSNFAGAYFERCRFISCKSIGTDMTEVIFKNVYARETNFQFSNFNKCRFSNVFFEAVNMTEVSIADAKIKSFEAIQCKFIKNDFFKTLLNGVDFSNNELRNPMISDPPVELKGTTVNMLQAAELIQHWGIRVSS